MGDGTRRRVGASRATASAIGLAAVPFLVGHANAAEAAASIGSTQVAGAALIAGLGLFSAFCGVAMLRARRRAERVQRETEDEIRTLSERLARAEALNRFDDQIVVMWDDPAAPPKNLAGSIKRLKGVPGDVGSIITFDVWLAPESALGLKHLVSRLRTTGEGFSTTVRTQRGDHLEAEGRCAGTSALLRFRDLSTERAELARIAERHAALLRDVEVMRALFTEMPHPVWIRDADGRIAWVNPAYARAVDAPDQAVAVEREVEFLDASARKDAQGTLASGKPWRRRITAVMAGQRRSFEVVVTPLPRGSAGVATDVSDVELGKKELERLVTAHQRTLDNLPTPVAVFGADRRLAYFNAAWRELWGLEVGFLADRPEEGAILDRLREMRRLPEQANFREWKAQHLEAYRSVEPREYLWHLPDGRTIRGYAQPNPQGGLTVIQENVTEVLDLQSRYATSERIQRETLEALTDAVAVFGSDGRLKLSNPAFAAMWRVPPASIAEGHHVDRFVAEFGGLVADAAWTPLKAAILAFGEERVPASARLTRRDGAVVDMGTVALPDGATLVTFVDVTASVNVERALQEKADALDEKNAALVLADRLKNAFVQHVSYELRSPLTNIIGFAELLSAPTAGTLTPKQREYLSYITASSSTLLAIINNILDIAIVDAGAMPLDLTSVDVAQTLEAAADGVRARLLEEGITLVTDAAPNVGAFVADAQRVRQVLFHLLSNAIGFSERGQTVRLKAWRAEGGRIGFSVADQGRGIPSDALALVFDRFETRTAGTRHRGVGLGLSIVKAFVELHGGTVEITSEQGKGTIVTCYFPEIARDGGGVGASEAA